MRATLAVTVSLALAAACTGGTGGAVTPPCTGAGCTSNQLDGGSGSDAGDAGDGGDAGDAGDAGDGGFTSGCASFNGNARDFCRSGQPETASVIANGCDGTIYLNMIAVCTGSLDGGFHGSCNEGPVTLPCAASALPGTITCVQSATSTCSVYVCGTGADAGQNADGGCGP